MAVPVPPLNFTDAGMSTATVGPATVGGLTMNQRADWKTAAALAVGVVLLAAVFKRKRKG